MTAPRQLSGERPLKRQFKRRRKWPKWMLQVALCNFSLLACLTSVCCARQPQQHTPGPRTGVISISGPFDLPAQVAGETALNERDSAPEVIHQLKRRQRHYDNYEEEAAPGGSTSSTPSSSTPSSSSSSPSSNSSGRLHEPQLDGLLAAAESANASGLQERVKEESFRRRLMELRRKYSTRQAISDTAYYILLPIYSLLILTGTVANALICLTVILKPRILSPRNIFIVNLACSDLLLCVFTMPFSFIEISMRTWQMGLLPCKLVASLQATSIFVSTISITAIALDRYKVIVYPTHQESAHGTRGAALLVGAVWIGALLLSLPLFRVRTIEHTDLPERWTKVKSIEVCAENWPFAHGRGIYSVISMMFQYVLPISIVSVVYAKISDKLKKRLIRRQRLTQLECQQKRQLNLIRRTHTMLMSVSLIFALSWLPLNLLNVINDFTGLFHGDTDGQLFRYVFAACHLVGCSSACSNPILYGYLNENFRKEFHQVYTQHARRSVRLFRRLQRLLGLGGGGPDGGRGSPSSTADSSRAEGPGEETGGPQSNATERFSSVPDLSLSGRSSNRGAAHSSCHHLCAPPGPAGSSGANGPPSLLELESSSANLRRLSFQTLASSRQTLGRTMRLCLCVCAPSASNSQDSFDQTNRKRSQRAACACTCHLRPVNERRQPALARPTQGRRVWLRFLKREPSAADPRRARGSSSEREPASGELAGSKPNRGASQIRHCASCGSSERRPTRPSHHSSLSATAEPPPRAPAVRTTAADRSASQRPALGATCNPDQQTGSGRRQPQPAPGSCYLSVEPSKPWRRKGAADRSPSRERSTEVVLLNATDLDSEAAAESAAVEPTSAGPEVTVIPAQATAVSPAREQQISRLAGLERGEERDSGTGAGPQAGRQPTTESSASSSCGCLHSRSSSCTCSLSSTCPLQQQLQQETSGRPPDSSCSSNSAHFRSSCPSRSASTEGSGSMLSLDPPEAPAANQRPPVQVADSAIGHSLDDSSSAASGRRAATDQLSAPKPLEGARVADRLAEVLPPEGAAQLAAN